MGLPYMIVGPFIGAIVDRSDLRLVLIFSNLGRALTTGALIFAPNVAVVLILVFIRSSVDSAFTPARHATIKILASKDQLASVNTLVYGINQLSKIAGPAIGGLLLMVLIPQYIFAINMSLSLIATALVWGIVIPAKKIKPEQEELSLFSQVASGFNEIISNKKLLMGISFVSISLFAIFLYDSFIPLLAIDFGFDPSIFGLSIAMVGAGGVLGALIISKIKLDDRHLFVMAGGAFLAGIGIACLGLFSIFNFTPSIIVFIMLFFSLGLTGAFIHIPYVTLLQLNSPEDKIGSIMTLGQGISMVAMLSAPLFGGILAHNYSVAVPFIIGGVILIVISIVGTFVNLSAK